MPPDSSTFTTLNLPPTFELPQCMEYFTLKAGPNTDLWRKPPNGQTTTAPIVFTTLRHPFVVAEVTVSADWEQECDQGGLVIFAGAAPHTLTTETTPIRSRNSRPPCKWVKAGMEFSSGTVNASSVSATADGADWCLSPLAQGQTGAGMAIHSLRIKLERVGDALWIWYQVPTTSPYAVSPAAVGSTWKKLREVTWFFYGVEDKFVHVGVYASRPTGLGRGGTMWDAMHGMRLGSSAVGLADELVVEFEDLEIF
jgi:regulation of enolase protein 1 (concanavalin A-like superfamily)